MSVILLLPFAFLLVAAAIAIALLRPRGPSQPVCGKCSYAVRGLPSFICPECGSDLRQVGILAPGFRGPVTARTKVVLWTLLLPLPALFLTTVIVHRLPQVSTVTRSLRLVPASRSYAHIRIEATGTGREADPALTRAMLELAVSDETVPAGRLEIALPDMTTHPDAEAGTPQVYKEVVESDTLNAWMRESGVQTTEAEAEELMTWLRSLSDSGLNTPLWAEANLFNIRGDTRSTVRRPPQGALWGLVAFWILLWLGGIYRFAHKSHASHAMIALGDHLQS